MDRFVIKKPRVEFEEELASKTDGEKPTCSTSDSSMIEFEKEEGCGSEELHSAKKHLRKFQSSWISRYQWIQYNKEADKAFCSLCRQANMQNLLLFSTKKEDTFIATGFSNWKKALEKFSAHEKSQCHREAATKLASLTHVSVANQLQNQSHSEMVESREALMAIFTTLRFLSRQGLAIRGKTKEESNFIQCLEMRADDSEVLNKWLKRSAKFKWLSPEIQNECVNIMARQVLDAIISKIKKCEKYSLIMDETCDISCKELISFCIRVATEDLESIEYFVGLYETSSTDAATLFKIVKDVMIRLDLGIENLRGQCYDGASNMSGRVSGLKQRLCREQPLAVYFHCLAHSVNLSIQDSLKSVQLPRDMMYLVKDLINTIRESPKRLHWFQSLQAGEEGPAPKHKNLRPLCPTRWTMRVTSIRSVLRNYNDLLVFLEDFSNEDKSDAGAKCAGFVKQLQTFKVFFCLKLFLHVFGPIEEFSQGVQSPKLSVSMANSQLRSIMSVIQEKRNAFKEFWEGCCTELPAGVDAPSLPRVHRVSRRYEDPLDPHSSQDHVFQTPEDYYRKVYYEIFDCILCSLDERFLKNHGFQAANKMETEIVSAVNGRKYDIQQVLANFKDDVDPERLKLHLSMFSDVVKSKELNIASLLDIVNILKKEQPLANLLSELSRLIRFFLTLPVTTCTAERSFSTLRRLKNYLRTTMRQDRLNNIALLNTHKDITDQLDLQKAVNSFILCNEIRRLSFALYK